MRGKRTTAIGAVFMVASRRRGAERSQPSVGRRIGWRQIRGDAATARDHAMMGPVAGAVILVDHGACGFDAKRPRWPPGTSTLRVAPTPTDTAWPCARPPGASHAPKSDRPTNRPSAGRLEAGKPLDPNYRKSTETLKHLSRSMRCFTHFHAGRTSTNCQDHGMYRIGRSSRRAAHLTLLGIASGG